MAAPLRCRLNHHTAPMPPAIINRMLQSDVAGVLTEAGRKNVATIVWFPDTLANV